MLSDAKREEYLALLSRELVPALGCTEPIAIAYAGALARKILGEFPTKVTVRCSGNIIKNVKSVIVPTTGDQRGIEVSALLGVVAGNADLGMEVLQEVSSSQVEQVKRLRETGICSVEPLYGCANLHIIMELETEDHSALVEIRDAHTNVVQALQDGEPISAVINEREDVPAAASASCDMCLPEIYEFACTAPMERLAPVLEPQIKYNTAIAEQGLTGHWGAEVGRTLMEGIQDDHSHAALARRAAAHAAAGSDARMGGCVLPVVINSGSGNQGLTVSLPVIVYAEESGADREQLLRALAFSNLVALYQKSYIGKLSAYCGAVSAGCGCAAGIAFLHGDSLEVIEDTITNTIANASGMICDGAKSSCAAKIATAVEAGFLGHDMAVRGRVFRDGEGLVGCDADHTIAAFGRMAREGMRATDEEILDLMVGLRAPGED